MIQGLRERWFRTIEEERAEIESLREETAREIALMRDWSTSDGAKRFREWLGKEIERNDEPKTDPSALQVDAGVRKGLRLCLRQLARYAEQEME